jgi:hypothetical protein
MSTHGSLYLTRPFCTPLGDYAESSNLLPYFTVYAEPNELNNEHAQAQAEYFLLVLNWFLRLQIFSKNIGLINQDTLDHLSTCRVTLSIGPQHPNHSVLCYGHPLYFISLAK